MNICSATGKYCYSEREAGFLVNQSKKGHFDKYNKKKRLTRKYRCEVCGCWHVTSMAYINPDVKEFYKRQQKNKWASQYYEE